MLRVVDAEKSHITRRFIKPHGVLVAKRALVHWGRADDWKVMVTTSYERARTLEVVETSLVFFRAVPRFAGSHVRALVEEAATRLGATHCTWFD